MTALSTFSPVFSSACLTPHLRLWPGAPNPGNYQAIPVGFYTVEVTSPTGSISAGQYGVEVFEGSHYFQKHGKYLISEWSDISVANYGEGVFSVVPFFIYSIQNYIGKQGVRSQKLLFIFRRWRRNEIVKKSYIAFNQHIVARFLIFSLYGQKIRNSQIFGNLVCCFTDTCIFELVIFCSFWRNRCTTFYVLLRYSNHRNNRNYKFQKIMTSNFGYSWFWNRTWEAKIFFITWLVHFVMK